MDELRAEWQDGVLSLTLQRPARKNALSSALYAELAAQLAQATADDRVGAVVLQGSADCFCAGNDIGDFLQHPPTDAAAPVFDFLRQLVDFPKPLLAAVCGPAVGIGSTMLLHCDLVWAGDNARFALPFVQLGLCPEAASSLLLAQRIGAQAANAMLLLGEAIDAAQALKLGLVHGVLAADRVAAHVQQQARKLAQLPAAAMLQSKRLQREPQRPALHKALRDEAEAFAALLAGPSAQQALRAFLARA